MAAQDRAQSFVLLGYRAMHASPGLDPQLFPLANLSLPLCLPFDNEFPVPTFRAVMREAEKVERLRPPLADPVTPFGSVFAEHDQPGLFLVERKAKLASRLMRSATIFRASASSSKTIKSRQHTDRYTAVRLPTPAMNPEIEHAVQEDVGQERADASPLRRAVGSFLRNQQPRTHVPRIRVTAAFVGGLPSDLV
jgi:hypothetical protein